MKEDKRVIKFRAFIEDYGEMYFVISVFRKSVNEDFQRIFIDKEAAEGHPANYRVGDGVHLMQFTGLLDKQGKEIYEGDIIKVHNGAEKCPYINLPIEWDNEYLTYVTGAKMAGLFETLADCMDYEPEVIGNTYEHPELLTPTTSKP